MREERCGRGRGGKPGIQRYHERENRIRLLLAEKGRGLGSTPNGETKTRMRRKGTYIASTKE